MSDITEEGKALVEEALEAETITRKGPYYYAVQEDGEDETIGKGRDEALAWLEENGFVEEVPEPADTAEEDTSEDDDGYDASKTYRHAGDNREAFAREGRADGYLYPGAQYNNLPASNDDIQALIEEGILRPIE